MPAKQAVTEEQADEALKQLSLLDAGESEAQEVQPVPEPEAAKPEEPAAEPVSAEEPAATPAETDDVESLKARLAERDAEVERIRKAADERLAALQQRNAESQRILRDRFLRKATVVDKAHKILKATRSESGVPEADVDRVIQEIEGTMNPHSVSYVPPETQQSAAEEQAIVLNDFLNEKGMSIPEAEEFGQWIKTEGATALSDREQALAARDLDGFLRIAHTRYEVGMRAKDKEAKRNDAVEAVRSVQRTQKEAARAASATTASPKRQPAAPKSVDVKKLTKNDISTLLRQSVEQYD